jgi:hypothetical protein
MPPLDRGELLTQSEILDKQTSSRAQQANYRSETETDKAQQTNKRQPMIDKSGQVLPVEEQDAVAV